MDLKIQELSGIARGTLVRCERRLDRDGSFRTDWAMVCETVDGHAQRKLRGLLWLIPDPESGFSFFRADDKGVVLSTGLPTSIAWNPHESRFRSGCIEPGGCSLYVLGACVGFPVRVPPAGATEAAIGEKDYFATLEGEMMRLVDAGDEVSGPDNRGRYLEVSKWFVHIEKDRLISGSKGTSYTLDHIA